MNYTWMALLVLVIFYGIYFTKMYLQKRQGIRTHQIGRRKEKGLHTVETFMSVATFAIVIVQLISVMAGWNYMPQSIRYAGFGTGIVGDLIFGVSVHCMRDSWRAGIPDQDKTKLVTEGIYAYSRNPAFLGFDLQYIGILLMYCNVLLAVFTVFAVVMLHLQILQEEKYMTNIFGDEYVYYRKHVLRYLGRK